MSLKALLILTALNYFKLAFFDIQASKCKYIIAFEAYYSINGGLMESYLIEKLSRESEEEIGIKEGEVLNRKIYSAGEDFVVNERRLFTKSDGISVRTHTRYVDFPTHKHNFVEMMIVLLGSITHEVEGERITLSKGEILILNKHASHSIKRSGERDIGVNVIMSDGFLGTVSTELSGTIFSSLLKENQKRDGAPMYLYFTTGERKYINNAIENLLFELTKDAPEISVMTKALSLLLQYLSIENAELLLSGSSTKDKESERRLEIISYVKNNYRTASLDELGEKLYLTPPYLSKIIKDYFGKSFKELVVDERMTKARELLLGTSLPVSDVIRSVGYENESYFHREFKRREGRTPLALRRSIKNNLP